MKEREKKFNEPNNEELSKAEIELLEQNFGEVLSPVLIKDFKNIQDFMQNSNNFFMYFKDLPQGYVRQAYKCRNVYKRFKYLYAEIYSLLEGQLNVPLAEENDESLIELAYIAYKIMSKLVDEYDENAMIDGKANENALVQ